MTENIETTLNLINQHHKSHDIFFENSSWIIKESPLSGRGLFATRDINPGEIIYKDHPLILGPRAALTCPDVCVRCYKMKNLTACPGGCGLPVCSQECLQLNDHEPECKLINRWKNGQNFSAYSSEMLKCLTPVRGLFLCEYEKRLMDCLKAHVTPQHGFEVIVLKKKFSLKISDEEDKYLRLVCSILDTNSFEVVTGFEQDTSSLRGLFPLSSIMNHRCAPNTMHIFDDHQNMVVKSTVLIKEGAEIFHSYVRVLWGTLIRRHHLMRTKHFLCNCPRCQDPTEFGSYLSALFCTKCKNYLLPNDPLTIRGAWKCSQCPETVPGKKIGTMITVLAGLLDKLAGPQTKVEDLLRFLYVKLPKSVPASNQITVELKLKLVWILGYHDGYLWTELADDLLDKKEIICNELVQLLDTLRCGLNKMRGLLLYELACTLRERQRRMRLQNQQDGKDYVDVTLDSNRSIDDLLQQSSEILMNDVNSPREIRERNWEKQKDEQNNNIS